MVRLRAARRARCASRSPPDGTFKGTSNVGTLTVWAVKGKFVSATKARMALQLKAICDGKGGTVSLELQS